MTCSLFISAGLRIYVYKDNHSLSITYRYLPFNEANSTIEAIESSIESFFEQSFFENIIEANWQLSFQLQ